MFNPWNAAVHLMNCKAPFNNKTGGDAGDNFHCDVGRKDCPSCRAELSEDFKKYLNKDLRDACAEPQ